MYSLEACGWGEWLFPPVCCVVEALRDPLSWQEKNHRPMYLLTLHSLKIVHSYILTYTFAFKQVMCPYLRDLFPCRMVAMAMIQSVSRSVLASPRQLMLWFTWSIEATWMPPARLILQPSSRRVLIDWLNWMCDVNEICVSQLYQQGSCHCLLGLCIS